MNRFLPAFFLTALCLSSPVLAQETAAVSGTTLEVSAQSNINAPPDMATISSGVVTNALTADAAMQENAKKMNAVFAAVKAAGVAEKDMQTSGINLYPQYDYKQNNEQPRITGYQANNNVSVILRDLKNVGPVLDALVKEGSNQLNGPTFGIENQDEFLDKARAEAVKKARKRAEIYASAAGMTVKRIIAISESTGYNQPPVYPMMKAMAMDGGARAETPVASGEVGMSVTVNVKFELTP